MNLGINQTSTATIIAQVEAAVDDQLSSKSLPTTIHAAAGSIRLDCELITVESIACAFAQLEVTTDSWRSAPLEQVKQAAESLAGRLNYLLEPIRTIETDSDSYTVQMRSMPPCQNEDGTRIYYEVQVAGGGKLSLVRYVKEPGQSRRSVPVQVTREVFLRLVSDFVAAAAAPPTKKSSAA